MLGGVCIDCGTTENLEFDHVDKNDKAFNVAKRMSYKYETILEEIKKCTLRCKECHIKRHQIEADLDHGNYTLYKKYKCRCELCTASNRDYMRKYRASKKLSGIV